MNQSNPQATFVLMVGSKMKKDYNSTAVDNLDKGIKKILGLCQNIEAKGMLDLSDDGAWNAKQIMGHLIDSAINNIQRFVRLQSGNLDNFPGYDQDEWVRLQKYAEQNFDDLTVLWLALNHQIIHVIKNIEERSLGNTWRIEDEDIPLNYLIDDYIDHLNIHAEQLGRMINGIAYSRKQGDH